MPWNKDNLPAVAQGKTEQEQEQFIKVANAVLKQTSNEGAAIQAGIAAMKKPSVNLTGVIPWIREGATYKGGRRIEISKDMIQTAHTNFNDPNRIVDLPLRLKNHSSDAPAAGWIKDMYLADIDGRKWAFAGVDWTPAGRKAVDNKDYGYISPEFNPNYSNRNTNEKQGTTMQGASLLNDPQLEDMPAPVAFSADGDIDDNIFCLTSDTVIPYNTNKSDNSDTTNKSYKTGETDMDFTKIAEKLSCGATEVEILAKIDQIESKGDESLSAIESLSAKVEKFDSQAAEIETLTSDVAAKDAKIEELSTSIKTKEAGDIVGQLITETKATDSQRDIFTAMYLKDEEAAKELFATLQPREELDTISGADGGQEPATTTEEEKLTAQAGELQTLVDGGMSLDEAYTKITQG